MGIRGRLALQSYEEACEARQASRPPEPAGNGVEMRYNDSSHKVPLYGQGAGEWPAKARSPALCTLTDRSPLRRARTC
jgi:hypothetical protein